MKLRFPEEFINKVRESSDLVEVASEYMTVSRNGDRYRGLCPFHREDTPSFYISSEKQLYHCFGCGAGGNVFNFVMNIEKLDFIDAVKFLAERARLPIPAQKTGSMSDDGYGLLQSIFNANLAAAKYFVYSLSKSPKAMEYLVGRGLDTKTVRRFGLGYAPDSWDRLYKHLLSREFSQQVILKAGLVSRSKSSDGLYDRFRDRIMFPIIDVTGKVIGFGGRSIADEKGPKYLNSPESPAFVKGNNLYGLNIAKKHITDQEIIVVEGYMDVISLHQRGIKNTVASLGTAFTPRQGELLKRYSSNIVIAYDSDAAGQAATVKGMDVLEAAGCKVRIIELPDGKDPDEFVRQYGNEGFKELIQEALPLIDYKIKLLEKRYDVNDRRQKLDYLAEVSKLLAGLKSELDISEYVKVVAQRTKVYETVLMKEISRIQGKGQRRNMYGKNRHNNSAGEYSYSVKAANLEAEKNILTAMLADRDHCSEIAAALEPEDFSDRLHRELFGRIIDKHGNDGWTIADLLNDFDDQQDINRVVWLADRGLPVDHDERDKFIDDCIKTMRRYKYKVKSMELKDEIDRLARKAGRTDEEENKYRELCSEYVNIQRKLKGL
jgi:DNA primase